MGIMFVNGTKVMETKHIDLYAEKRKANFIKRNANPKNKKAGDCVIRAITTATGFDYEIVRDGLFKTSVKNYYGMLDKKNFEKFLENIGWVKHKQPRKADNTKYFVGEIKELIGNRKAIISLANHLTAYDGDAIIDLWDCRKQKIGNYWTI